MTPRFPPMTALAIALAHFAWAADPGGQWEAEMPGPMGGMKVLFELKAEGARLTGTVLSPMMGEIEIEDGKIDGDTISFQQVMPRGPGVTMRYTGRVGEDQIEFTREILRPGGPGRTPGPVRFVARPATAKSIEEWDRIRDSIAREGPAPGFRRGRAMDPEQRARMQAAREKYRPREGELRTGDMAPEFDLSQQKSQERVRLSDFRGKKLVALIFGSYT